MASSIAALKGKLGTADYYLFCMKVQELVAKIGFVRPNEWKDMPVEAKYQRELNLPRIKRIVPYLVNDKDRFFGSIIVAGRNFGKEPSINFVPISSACDLKPLGNVNEAEAMKMGFLTLRGGEQFVVIDGQHRMKALQYAIRGTDDNGKEVPSDPQLADEDVSVILIDFNLSQSRQIFTQVNKNAVSITPGQRLITDDEDKIAVISRRIANDLVGGRMASIGTSLSEHAPEFTTLGAIYSANCAIVERVHGKNMMNKLTKSKGDDAPTPEQVKLCGQEINQTWSALLKGIALFEEVLKDTSKRGDDKRKEIRRDFLLGKPLPQVCLVRAYVRLTQGREKKPETKLSSKEAIAKLNRIPWDNKNRIWQNILWSGEQILTAKKNANMATDLIAYMAGEHLTNEERGDLLERYRDFYHPDDRRNVKLPSPV